MIGEDIMTKKMIKDTQHIHYDLDGLSLSEAMATLQRWNEEYQDAGLQLSYAEDYPTLVLAYKREETDYEYKKRLKAEEKEKQTYLTNKLRIEKQELALLEQLKKKYETN